MKLSASAAVVVTALGMALAPTAALATDTTTGAFKNCTAAYAAGYSNIPESDPRYGSHLDRDGDGVGCDQPPADFVPAEDRDKAGKGEDASSEDDGASEAPASASDGNLAETGGSNTTTYVAAGGGLMLVAGAGALAASRKRRSQS